MSDDNDDEKQRPIRNLHIVRDAEGRPKVSALLSQEQAKAMFMASQHLEWYPWAKSMGWRPEIERARYPDFPEWAKEKRETIARNQSEEIAEALFSHRPRWHADVLKTMKEYPEVADNMMAIIKKRMNDVIVMINEDEKARVQHVQAQKTGPFIGSFLTHFDNSELVKLSTAIRIVTDAKHKALMTDKWSAAGAEKFTDPTQFEAPLMEDQSWKVQLYDGQTLRPEEMSAMMKSYYDEPEQTIDVTSGDIETT